MPDTTYSVTFPGRFASLAKIAETTRKAAHDAGLDDYAIYMVETAVDEASSNIIEHAYGAEGIGDIEITYQITAEGLTVLLRDFGKPFDPSQIPEPELNAHLEDRKSNGLGLFFMRKMMDEVHFEFSNETGNVLKMVKRKEKSAG